MTKTRQVGGTLIILQSLKPSRAGTVGKSRQTCFIFIGVKNGKGLSKAVVPTPQPNRESRSRAKYESRLTVVANVC